MGATKNWNHDPFFDYVDRWMNEEHAAGGPFVQQMWNLYRPQADEIGAASEKKRSR
jgi:hypothetical protein